jgi:hypothetical protein
MKNFADALFFKLYALAKRTGNNEESQAMFTALLLISMIFSIIALAIVVYLECFIFHSVLLLTSIPAMLSIMVVVSAPFYFRFFHNKRYSKLYIKYKAKNFYNDKRGSWLMISFLFFAFLFAVSLGWVKC